VFHWATWILVNVTLFLLPAATSLTTILFMGSRLGLSGHSAPEEVAYVFAYLSSFAGALLIFFGECIELQLYANIDDRFTAGITFPRFFRYHLILPLIMGRRRHRSHFSFMSQRRLDRTCGKRQFTIFVVGASHRPLPIGEQLIFIYLLGSISYTLVVTNYTTAREIYSHISKLGLAPTNPVYFYFIFDRRRVLWTDSVGSLGLGPLSHLHLRLRVSGGAPQGMTTLSIF
jgi:hypothetical protein